MTIPILRDVQMPSGHVLGNWLGVALLEPGGLDQMISKVPFQPQLHAVPRRAELRGAKVPTAS